MSQERMPQFGMFWYRDTDKPTIDHANAQKYFINEAYAHGCATRLQVQQDYGVEWALERYVSCDEVMEKLVLERAQELNPELLRSLVSPTTRLPDEPVGAYEEGAVPENYASEMNLGSMSYGYSIPRVIIEAMGRDRDGRLQIDEQILPTLVDGIETAIQSSSTPYELLAKLANFVTNLGVSAESLLSHIFAQGIITEQNCVSQYRQIEASLEQFAPTLWSKYDEMSNEEKTAHDVWVLS